MTDQKQQQDSENRTGKYGGDDGALEHERAEIQPGEDTGLTATPSANTGKTQAQQQQEHDEKTGGKNPGSQA